MLICEVPVRFPRDDDTVAVHVYVPWFPLSSTGICKGRPPVHCILEFDVHLNVGFGGLLVAVQFIASRRSPSRFLIGPDLLSVSRGLSVNTVGC